MLRNVVSTLILHIEDIDRILFKLAFHYAADGKNVWFIAPERFTSVPTSLEVPETEILKLLTFLYLRDHNQLFSYLNRIHLWQKIPSVIILNTYGSYIRTVSEAFSTLKAALVTTVLLDSAAACAKKLNEVVRIIISLKLPEIPAGDLKLLCDLYYLKPVYPLPEEDATLKEITDYLGE